MDASIAVLVDAKREYTKQLIQSIRSHLLSGMLSIYDEAFSVCEENKEPDLTMLTFQELLGEVPKWNSVMISDETNRIVDESCCDYLEDLLTAVFVCHTKILTTVRVTNKDRKINLKIPSVENFLHQVYIEMAREFWKHPYLLNPMEVSKLEYQQNLRKAENIIHDCLESTVRKLLPVKDILKEYLNEDHFDDEPAEEDDDCAPESSEQRTRKSSKKRRSSEDEPEPGTPGKSPRKKAPQEDDLDNDDEGGSYKHALRKELCDLKANAKTAGVTFENDPSSATSPASTKPSRPNSKAAGLPGLLTSLKPSGSPGPSPPGSPTKPAFDKMVDQLEKGLTGMAADVSTKTGGGDSNVKQVNIIKGGGSTFSTPATDTTSGPSSHTSFGAPSSSSVTPLSQLLSGTSDSDIKTVSTGGSNLSTESSKRSSYPFPAQASSLFGNTGPSSSAALDAPNASTTSTQLLDLSTGITDISSPASSPPPQGGGATELDLDGLLGGGGAQSDMPVVNVDFGSSTGSSSSASASSSAPDFTFF